MNIPDPPRSQEKRSPYSTKYSGAAWHIARTEKSSIHTAFTLGAAAAAAVAANVEHNRPQKNTPQHMSYKDWITKMHENVFKNAKKVIKVTPELRKEIEIRMSALIMEKNIVVTEEGESNVLIIDT